MRSATIAIGETVPMGRLSTAVMFGLACSLSAITLGQLPSGVATAAQTDSPDTRLQQNLESFDKVWSTVKDQTWDPEFDLAGWTAERDRLRPKINAESSRKEARKIMGELLRWLDRSHFGIIPQSLYKDWAVRTQSGGHAGIHFRLVDGHATVSQVLPDTDAARQDVQPGWRLVRLEGKPIPELLELLRESLLEHADRDLPMTLAYALDRRMQGAEGDEIALEFETPEGETQELSIKLQQLEGEVVEIANLPRMVMRQETQEVATGIFSFHFDGFFAPMKIMTAWKSAVDQAKQGRGLILDLRGNGGGLVGMTMGIARQLARDDNLFLGTLRTKDDSLRLVMLPSASPYDGPVAVLTDEASASAAEILAGGLQAVGRARVFGTRTAGAALPSIVTELPNGDRFQYAFASYIDFKERCIEGNGVTPDEVIPLERRDLVEGRDAVMAAAIQWISRQDESGFNADDPPQ